VDLDQADAVLTAAGLVPPPPATTHLESVDPLRRLFAPMPDAGTDDLLLNLAALMAAAQMLGATERMLSMAADYAKTRKQFGQPIGSFQAVKHLLANVAVRLEFARPVVWRAAYALHHGHPHAPTHVSHAKLAATDAAMLAAETAIQVHGAMGYTYEVDLHYWMKRTWALAGAWGDVSFHQQRVDQAIFGGLLPIGPGATFSSEDQHA
jgi:alkylation response protein AidB-like acyl-CoA dehydrogenase